MVGPSDGGSIINSQTLRARLTDARSVWIATIAIPLLLLAPAFWNGYPLLQWDTGGYLARCAHGVGRDLRGADRSGARLRKRRYRRRCREQYRRAICAAPGSR
ncbi:MAG: hypothetical protein CFE30_21610 [Bradyrhizobium sp. PARBB1]|nr:MAG: hypothetical protein CFE30_21610 [Bradyrhizobium sp. PARBB1]HAR13737.1 hypothetical protein [Bradyrhizobium sp.]HAR24076.1 hypothetical protein [Bradyrhizobium sp.]HBY29325.1 hypothetical protein [Bradyrhizobium sp.]